LRTPVGLWNQAEEGEMATKAKVRMMGKDVILILDLLGSGAPVQVLILSRFRLGFIGG